MAKLASLFSRSGFVACRHDEGAGVLDTNAFQVDETWPQLGHERLDHRVEPGDLVAEAEMRRASDLSAVRDATAASRQAIISGRDPAHVRISSRICSEFAAILKKLDISRPKPIIAVG